MATDDRTVDLCRSQLDLFPEHLQHDLVLRDGLAVLILAHNRIRALPRSVAIFHNLRVLDIDNNGMKYMSPDICRLRKLVNLSARNNLFDNDALPSELALMTSLQDVNFSGNLLTEFPMQLTKLFNLTSIHLGANRIEVLPPEIGNIARLEVLYLGGNRLRELPVEVCRLARLRSLTLCDNALRSLPGDALAHLRCLRSLSLHNNQLSLLPPAVATLRLSELSLRGNPLVARFVQDMVHAPPSLQELAGRVVKVRRLQYDGGRLPAHLVDYLDMAHRCVNTACKGVYFSSRVEHVKFVDFCGKYRIPLLEYLCSLGCRDSPTAYSSDDSSSESEDEVGAMVKKVLLG